VNLFNVLINPSSYVPGSEYLGAHPVTSNHSCSAPSGLIQDTKQLLTTTGRLDYPVFFVAILIFLNPLPTITLE